MNDEQGHAMDRKLDEIFKGELMYREIKFRAWNTRRKEMEIIDDLYWFEENQCHHNGDNDYVLQ